MGVLEDLRQARDAYERRDWVSAYRALSEVDEAGLAADDFMALATTAYLLGRHNDCVQALQRAHRSHVARGETREAARVACWLALVLMESGEVAVGGGWAARAERLLDGVEGDVVERGYVLVHHLFRHVATGDFGSVAEVAAEIVAYGHRFGDPDLLAFGLNARGRGLTMAGQVADGLRLLDEAMVGVLAGEVSPIFAGMVYCSMIEACQWVADYGRVREWTHALTAWCDVQPGLVAFTGQCAVHRGQLMKVQGAYDDALTELDRALARYAAAGGSAAVGLAHYEQGDVLRLQGAYAEAAVAFETAVRAGHDAQPGRSLLWVALGRVDTGVAAIKRAVAEATGPVERSRVLLGAVEILLAAGEADVAADLAEELSDIADAFGCAALRGSATYAVGLVALSAGNADRVVAAARAAGAAWESLSAAYDVARSHALLGRGLQLLGEDDSALAELTAARDALSALGAGPAAHDVDAALRSTTAPGGLSVREVEVLRLVAAGRSNAEIAAELVLSQKTVARHLSNIFAKIDVRSRTAAAAFAYEHHLV
jgi:DNA-binding NarL/FixJ family response regulator